jgi:diguanylate cyclase (GGDEF)-like protein
VVPPGHLTPALRFFAAFADGSVMPWQVAFLASVAIAIPYFAISWFVARGLAASGQLSSNRLGLATALIFFSCGVGHALHAAHLVETPSYREVVDTHIVMWDVVTAAIAIWYLSLRGRFGQLLLGPSMFEDEDRLASEAKARHDAHHDHLTGLPNRAAFMDAAKRALAASNGDGTLTAVIFVDFDDFKPVNDRLGHVAGDALLLAAAQRLSSAVRPDDLVARLGGDEFVVLLGGGTSEDEASSVAMRLIDSLRVPFQVAGEAIPLSASAGVALGLAGETNPAELLHRADEAMYAAKAGGRNRLEVFA